jgi:hypothetical protein
MKRIAGLTSMENPTIPTGHRRRGADQPEAGDQALIGYVAYWGGAFEHILDGVSGPGQPDENGRAARLDATRHELELGVPFSLHSDAPTSLTHPLWYVEQAVSRISENVPGYPGMSPNIQGCTQIAKNVPEFKKTSRNSV